MQNNTAKKLTMKIAPLLIGITAMLLSGCSLNRLAVNVLADAVASGDSDYARDNDPELIREALPFGLKTLESLLRITPNHERLLLAASRGFSAYAFILQNESERNVGAKPEQKRETSARIRNLFLRSRDYALCGLAARHPDFANRLRANTNEALANTHEADVPFLYWAGAAWGGAISVAKSDLALIVELPLAGALVRRVLEIDEGYEHGAAHEFFIAYEAARPGGTTERARHHYRRALELSGGQRASAHLALAQAVSVREQNLVEFRTLLAAAMQVPVETTAEFRLVNNLARRHAVWLSEHIEDFFVEAPPSKENAG